MAYDKRLERLSHSELVRAVCGRLEELAEKPRTALVVGQEIALDWVIGLLGGDRYGDQAKQQKVSTPPRH